MSEVIRPKVFRPPQAIIAPPRVALYKRVTAKFPYIVLGCLFIMLAMSSAPAHKPDMVGDAVSVQTAKRLPSIIVTPRLDEADKSVQYNKKQEVTRLALNHPPQHLPESLHDAHSTLGAMMVPADRGGDMIVLEGNDGMIIGQMARIPLESEQITEVKPIEDIDNGAGRELLSIINKY